MSRHNPIELSIIIVSFNTKRITQNCLDSVYKSFTPEFEKKAEVIVVDNNSTDSSVDMLKVYERQKPNLRCIFSNENLGFGKANNIAVERAQGKYILFLNSDIEVLGDAVQTMHKLCVQSTQIHFLGGKLLNSDKSEQPSAGPFFQLQTVIAFLFLKGDAWGLTRYSPDVLKKVDWVSGACIMTRKEYFEDIHGFDENIFMYMEEVDLLYRANKNGFSTYFTPEAEFIHLGSASSDKTYPILQVYQGLLYFYKKHYPLWHLQLLKGMLKLKAITSLLIGKLIGNTYLIKTYAKAYKIASLA